MLWAMGIPSLECWTLHELGDALPPHRLSSLVLSPIPRRAPRSCHARLCSCSRPLSRTTEAEISIKNEK